MRRWWARWRGWLLWALILAVIAAASGVGVWAAYRSGG